MLNAGFHAHYHEEGTGLPMADFCVGDIEKKLFESFLPADATENDRFGLLVGDRRAIVTKIAISLDQSISMIDAAAALGCNLLVSHHPVFWTAPDSFLAADSVAASNGARVYRAIQNDVALLSMHTNLDCSPFAARMLLDPVGLEYTGPLRAHGTGSLGQVARPAGGRSFITLGELAENYRRNFSRVAKVWGDPNKPLFTVAACSGGAGMVIPDVIAAGVDCFVTGEVRHDEALDLDESDIALIELGHDISELSYRYYIQGALISAGFPAGDIIILEPTARWWQPGVAAPGFEVSAEPEGSVGPEGSGELREHEEHWRLEVSETLKGSA